MNVHVAALGVYMRNVHRQPQSRSDCCIKVYTIKSRHIRQYIRREGPGLALYEASTSTIADTARINAKYDLISCGINRVLLAGPGVLLEQMYLRLFGGVIDRYT